MTLVVPTVGKNENLTCFLTDDVTLKLFSNNHTPVIGDTLASYTEVSGGGYASKTLSLANWTISGGIATYNAAQDFTFTGTTVAPGTVYGYYVIVGLILLWAERFPGAVLPFSPINGSLIRITPRLVVGDS